MAEFQWWLLLVGLVAGGGLVAVVFFDSSRRESDLAEDERRAEANWISSWLRRQGRAIGADDVEAILRTHRDYLELPPPDRLVPEPAAADTPAPRRSAAGADPDREPDEIRDESRGSSDEDLAPA